LGWVQKSYPKDMKKHICVFLAFQNYEHIKLSFDSLLAATDVDFFVVENKSDQSSEIESYFKTKQTVGYIQFDQNIAANAITIFIERYSGLLSQYEYITITDGDIYVYDAKAIFDEIRTNLEYPSAMISSANLYFGNDYRRTIGRIIGILPYIEFMKQSVLRPDYPPLVENTGNTLLTIKNENLFLIQKIYYIDTFIKNRMVQSGGIWVCTTRNVVYHLTWDLYIDGEPYYEWKKLAYPQIWSDQKICDYKIIQTL
jgi:hypothetical protein